MEIIIFDKVKRKDIARDTPSKIAKPVRVELLADGVIWQPQAFCIRFRAMLPRVPNAKLYIL